MQKFLLVSWNISEPIKKKKEMNKKNYSSSFKTEIQTKYLGKNPFFEKSLF